MPEATACGVVRPLLAELATGAVTGQARAEVLAHVAACAPCRQELAALSRAVDELLLLAPATEPPAGFESAVMSRLGGLPARARRRPWRHVPESRGATVSDPRPRRRMPGRALAPALAVVLALGIAAGSAALVWWRTADDRNLAAQHRQALEVADGRYLRAAAMTTHSGVRAGTVFLYQGNPSWVLVTIAMAPTDGPYEMVLVSRDGGTYSIGVCQVTAGTGTASYRLNRPVSSIAAVRLTGPGGARLDAAVA